MKQEVKVQELLKRTGCILLASTLIFGSTGTLTYVNAAELTKDTLQTVATDEEFVIDANGVLTHYNGTAEHVVIPSNVTAIGKEVFSDSETLASVEIPISVVNIGADAFSYCRRLKNIEIPASVKSIGKHAFSGCGSLQTIIVAEGNTNYLSEDGILYNAAKTELIQCPGGKKGDITIPTGVIDIADAAFAACRNITGIMIPSGVKSIGEEAFSTCVSIKSITLPSSVEEIGECAFWSCVNLTGIIIPSSVKSIEKHTFVECSNLASVTIPFGVEKIDENAFTRCTALTSVTIPSSVKSIGRAAFDGCTELKSIEIPSSVTEIGDFAFADCVKLTIYGEDNSYTQTYAKKNGISFKNISELNTIEITKLKITAPNDTKKIAAGKKVKLKVKVSPANATNKAVVWSVSNKKYATVKNGVVKAKKAGKGKTVTITAKAKDGSKEKATYKIQIMKDAVKSVKLKASKSVKAGKKTTVKATVKTTGKNVNKTLAWTSSNTKYATVNKNGVVKAKKAGKGKTVTITASATDGSGKKAKVKIKIK